MSINLYSDNHEKRSVIKSVVDDWYIYDRWQKYSKTTYIMFAVFTCYARSELTNSKLEQTLTVGVAEQKMKAKLWLKKPQSDPLAE